MYCRQHFTENYKKMYETWRQRKPECRKYVDANKLMNQRNYIMKHKKKTQMEVEEIRRELQESQRSQLEEREEETETHQQRNQIHKLKEKIENTYYQVTQIEFDKRPRLQKLQNMIK